MAITLVGAESATSDAVVFTVDVTKPAGTASNDVVLAVAAVDDIDPVDLPTGFTVLHDQQFNNDTRFKVGYKVAGGSEPSSYTFGKEDNQTGAFSIVVFRGVNTTTTIDVSPSYNTGDSTTPTAPGITTTTDNAMVIAAYGHEHGAGTITSPPSGLTTAITDGIATTIGAAFGVAYTLKATAGGTSDFVFTVGDEDTWGAIAFAFMDENESPPPVTASGALTAGSATVDGAGSAFTVITGSGVVEAERADVGGVGSKFTGVSASGALAAAQAGVSGVAQRGNSASGSLSAQQASLAGDAARAITGAVAFQAAPSTVSSTAERTVTGAGALAAQRANTTGEAIRVGDSQGELTAGQATVAATVLFQRNASGALEAQPVVTGNTSKITWNVTASLSAQRATAAPAVNVYRGIVGSGALSAQRAELSGALKRGIPGTGALVAGPVVVYPVSWLRQSSEDGVWKDLEGGEWVAKD